jgi:magnesium-dependent phosphatase 1
MLLLSQLQLAVFDLDFCVWKPEMHQIQGPPILTPMKTFEKKKRKAKTQPSGLQLTQTTQKGMTVTDRAGTPITLFDGAYFALSEINKMKRQDKIQTAVASSTDKPPWARQCLEWMIVEDGSTLASCFGYMEIRSGDKQRHFESLNRISGIPFENMCFFDDTRSNILSVSQLGVKCVHTPSGLTRDAWKKALDMFE